MGQICSDMTKGDAASQLEVRLARIQDSRAIAEIYNQGIEERVATFETEPRSPLDIEDALRGRGDRYPTVVATIDDVVGSVAWASEYRSRQCYAGIAEFSVYTHRSFRGRGLARRVVERLVVECETRGFWKLVSRVFPENEHSRRLCRSLGFREVGVYHRHGKLDGAWRDCVIMEKLIGEGLESDWDGGTEERTGVGRPLRRDNRSSSRRAHKEPS